MRLFFYALSAWAELMAVRYPISISCHRQFFCYLNLEWTCTHDAKNMSCIINRDGIWHYHPELGWVVRQIGMPEEVRKRLSYPLFRN